MDFSKNTPKRKCPDIDLILSIIEKRSAAYRTQINEYRMENKDYTLETLVQRTDKTVRNMTVGDYLDLFVHYKPICRNLIKMLVGYKSSEVKEGL